MRPAYEVLAISILFAACESLTTDPGAVVIPPDTNSGIYIDVNVFSPITTVSSPIADRRQMSGLVTVHIDCATRATCACEPAA